MKKAIVLATMIFLGSSTFAYKAKSEDLSKYSIETYKIQIQDAAKKSNVNFNEMGKTYDSPAFGYYNFVPLEENGKVVAYAGLTHVKSYNKHEALIAIISPEGKLMGFHLPDANEKHTNVLEKEWIQKYVGKTANEFPTDGLAGSTFHANSVNGELRNLLSAFNYKKEEITGKK